MSMLITLLEMPTRALMAMCWIRSPFTPTLFRRGENAGVRWSPTVGSFTSTVTFSKVVEVGQDPLDINVRGLWETKH